MLALSDFDVMWHRLENWGRWGRQDSCRPDPESVTAGVYDMGRADRQGEGESGEDAEPGPVRIDAKDAERLDPLILALRHDRRRLVCLYFYRRRGVSRPLLAEAVRAVIDADHD
jgi:hypothetical protein